MANKTINDLTEATSAVDGDFLALWRAANGDTRKISKANLQDGFLTGDGTITGGGTVATGGNTLTVGGASTVNGSLVGNMTGGGTVATGGFTGTLPATGTLALLAAAQTFSALQTFGAGINLGGSTLSTFVEGSWTPTLTFGGGSTGLGVSGIGRYQRVGSRVTAIGRLTVSAVGSSTGAAVIGGLPVTASNFATTRIPAAFYHNALTHTGTIQAYVDPNTTNIVLENDADGVITSITHAAFTAGDIVVFEATYWVGA